jgi:Uma2 family endonuclease
MASSIHLAKAGPPTLNGCDPQVAARVAEFQSLPMVHEDDPEMEMGEANLHALVEHILRYGLEAHFAPLPAVRVFSNLNLYYQPKFPSVYVSPDVMVVRPKRPKNQDVRSYRLEHDGPAPLCTAEVMSEETARVGDLETKPYIYAMIGVPEYILIDQGGQYLPERLVLKRLQADRTWIDEQDSDGGITSHLGFRLIWDNDGGLRVVHAQTGKRYIRPNEAQAAADSLAQAAARIEQLETELTRLKNQQPAAKKRKKP